MTRNQPNIKQILELELFRPEIKKSNAVCSVDPTHQVDRKSELGTKAQSKEEIRLNRRLSVFISDT